MLLATQFVELNFDHVKPLVFTNMKDSLEKQIPLEFFQLLLKLLKWQEHSSAFLDDYH